MATLTTTIKLMLNALAHADAGEYLTPLQKSQHIKQAASMGCSQSSVILSEEPPVSNRQQVALYMGSELPADIMNYVIQTCVRLKHGLTLLTFQPEDTARAVLSPYLESLKSAGVSMQLVALTGEPLAGLARYLRRHPEVAFLACNETGYLGRSFLNGTQRRSALPVPVVLVQSHASGEQHNDKPLPKSAEEKHRVA